MKVDTARYRDNSTIASEYNNIGIEGMFFATETDVNGTFEVNIPETEFTMLAFNTLNNYGMGMIITPNNQLTTH